MKLKVSAVATMTSMLQQQKPLTSICMVLLLLDTMKLKVSAVATLMSLLQQQKPLTL
jgi:hypothetical protein